MSPVRPTVTVIGLRDDAAHHELRDMLTRSAQPHAWLEAGSTEADAALAARDATGAQLPVVIDGDEVHVAATMKSVADAWRISSRATRTHYDLAIVGAGPAGLGAAVYAASDGLATVLIEREVPGGQAAHTSLIENFFGFPDGIGASRSCSAAGCSTAPAAARRPSVRATT